MGTHHNVHLTALYTANDVRLLFCSAETRKHLHLDGEALKTLEDGVIMLEGQDGGRHQNSALLTLAHTLKGGTECHLGLAESHVAAEQTIHRHRPLHIPLDFVDTPQLVLGFLILKVALEIVLPLLVRPEGIAGGRHTLGVQCHQLLGDVLHRTLDAGLGLLPLLTAQTVELEGHVLLGTDVFAHQIQLGYRHVQRIPFGIF